MRFTRQKTGGGNTCVVQKGLDTAGCGVALPLTSISSRLPLCISRCAWWSQALSALGQAAQAMP
eukprot:2189756-Rhodomonas_salina.3